MKKNHQIVLVAASVFLAILLFFADESQNSFMFLSSVKEVFNLMFFAVLFSILPLVLYSSMKGTANQKRLAFAGFGLLPAVLLLVLILS
jgi:hypothetical protein